MYNALQYSHQLLKKLVQHNPKGLFVDATLGNGHDSYFILSLSDFTGEVIGFDIQELAIQNSLARAETLSDRLKGSYHFHLDSHKNVDQYLNNRLVQGAIFNLGYLPGGDHDITTMFDTTYEAVNKLIQNLALHGQIIIVIYSGHANGMVEKNHLTTELSQLPQEKYQVLSYQFVNQKNNPPSLLVIERIK